MDISFKEKAYFFYKPPIPLRNPPLPLHADTIKGQKAVYYMQLDFGKLLRILYHRYRPICSEFPAGICILSDGTITTCCHDPFGRNRFSSIYSRTIDEVWKKDVDRTLKCGLYNLEGCRDCIGSPMASITSTRKQYSNWRQWSKRYPNFITIEIMGACNYGCCVSREMKKHRSTLKPDLGKIFEQIKSYLPHVKELRLFNYGEPLLHDDFSGFIEKCRSQSDRLRLYLATNGLLMDERYSQTFIANKLDYIIVSVHGGPGTANMLKYSRYGADYDCVLFNVKRLLEMRNQAKEKRPSVGLRAILFNWNDSDSEMDKFRKDARSLGLKATSGEWNTDNYHWMLDVGTNGQLSSRRFTAGSSELKKLISARELGQ
jgi:hypothetical protein